MNFNLNHDVIIPSQNNQLLVQAVELLSGEVGRIEFNSTIIQTCEYYHYTLNNSKRS